MSQSSLPPLVRAHAFISVLIACLSLWAAPGKASVPQSNSSDARDPKGAKQGTVVVTRAVGEVGDRVVTSREARINQAVEQALTGKAAQPEGFRIVMDQEKTFPAEVSRVLDEWIVYLEAKSLSSQPPTRGDVSAAVKTVQEFWGGKTAWQQLEVSSEELREMVERKLIAKEFERLKSDPQMSPVSDEDALAYFRKNRLRFGSLPFSNFKENIKEFLVKSQTERRLAEWREVLRRKYKVRNFIAG
jgi:hypothetical protein